MGNSNDERGRWGLRRRQGVDSGPVKVGELELSEPLAPISLRRGPDEHPYRAAMCLVRLHGRPLALLEIPAADGEAQLGAERLAAHVWRACRDAVAFHLRADGLPVPRALPPAGLSGLGSPRCLAERARARSQAPAATVVVATRERPASLSRCLDSLLELDYPDYEIVVVDNAPLTSATRDLLAAERFRGRVIYTREERRGLAAAHNRGLAVACGTIVAFTDDDVTADRLWLLELARGFGLADGVACVTGLILPAALETPAQLIAERLWGWGKGFTERVFDRTTDGGDPLYPYTAGTFGSGANMAFATAALRDLGGFDPATGAGTPARGGDDLAGFFSVIAGGHRLVYNPAALVRHAHHADYEALRRQAYGYGVGLTAYLTKTVVEQPGRALDLGRAARHGLRRARHPRAGSRSAATTLPRPCPPDLAWAERWGMLAGPSAYLRSRRQARRRGSIA